MPVQKADPERIAKMLIADLKGGSISRINRDIIAATIDAQLDRHDGSSRAMREQLIADTSRYVAELNSERVIARAA